MRSNLHNIILRVLYGLGRPTPNKIHFKDLEILGRLVLKNVNHNITGTVRRHVIWGVESSTVEVSEPIKERLLK